MCCGGWGITVSDAKYFSLLGLECSEKTRRILDCALAPADDPSPERYAVMKPSYEGKCRLIDENGLCSLQVECGEGVLPAVCRMYPRSYTDEHAVCSASCERTVELLMRKEPLTFSPEPQEPLYGYIKRMQDRSLPLKERVMSLIKDAFGDGENRGADILLQLYADAMEEAGRDLHGIFAGDGAKRPERTDKIFPDMDMWLENLMVNRMVMTGFPSGDVKTAVCGVACEYAILQRVAAGCETEIQFVDAVSDICRFICHTRFDKNSAAAMKRADAYNRTALSSVIL